MREISGLVFFGLVGCQVITGTGSCQAFSKGTGDPDAGSQGGSTSSGAGGQGNGLDGGGGHNGGGGSGSAGGSGCDDDQKSCGGNCVSKNDPAYGCVVSTCDPCDLPHATAACVDDSCVVDTCDQDYDDCNHDGLSCETHLLTTPEFCGSCDNACPVVTGVACVEGECHGPCGELAMFGWSICYLYDHTMHTQYPTLNVGLAGAIVSPGGVLASLWSDPMTGASVNPDATQDFVMRSIGDLPPDSYVQFRPGLHAGTSNGTTAGTFACGEANCSGSCYIYFDGEEVGKLESHTLTGVLGTTPHFVPPYFLDLYFLAP